MSVGGHLGFWALQVSKKCNPIFWFSSHQNKVKSITISLWASDSYGSVKSILGGLHYYDKYLHVVTYSDETIIKHPHLDIDDVALTFKQ